MLALQAEVLTSKRLTAPGCWAHRETVSCSNRMLGLLEHRGNSMYEGHGTAQEAQRIEVHGIQFGCMRSLVED